MNSNKLIELEWLSVRTKNCIIRLIKLEFQKGGLLYGSKHMPSKISGLGHKTKEDLSKLVGFEKLSDIENFQSEMNCMEKKCLNGRLNERL